MGAPRAEGQPRPDYPTGDPRLDYLLESASDLEGYGSPEEFSRQDSPRYVRCHGLLSDIYKQSVEGQVVDEQSGE